MKASANPVEIPLHNLCQSITDGDHQAPPRAESGVPFITISAMRKGSVDLDSAVRFVPPAYAASLDASRKPKAGDVLYSVTGSIGLSALVSDRVDFVFQRHIAILRPDQNICDPRWLNYILASPQIREQAQTVATGTAQLTVPLAGLRSFKVPLSSLTRQRDTVAKLDALNARITRIRAELDSASRFAKALRKTAVESAFSHNSCAGSVCHGFGDNIILQDLVDEGPTNGWSPPSGADATGALTLKLTATTSGRLRLDSAAVKRIYDTPPDTSKFWLQTGDLLIQRANALEHVGATAIYEGPPKTYIYPDLMMRFRVSDPKLTRLLWYYFNSPRVRAHFRDKATGTAGNMPKISGAIVRRLTFPKLSEVERELTLERLDATFARADRLEAEAARATALLDRLEASILAKAFSGQLVPQDPADEPAIALLDRIRAERAAAPKARRGRVAGERLGAR